MLFVICASQSSYTLAKTLPPTQTKINNLIAAKALLGKHKLTHQAISWSYFGSIDISNFKGRYYVKGSHFARAKSNNTKPDYFKISGQITEINNSTFKFEGRMETRLKTDKYKVCEKTGTFYFAYRKGKSRSWRLLNDQHTCTNHIVFIDIYVNRKWAPKRPFSKSEILSQKWGTGLLLSKSNSFATQYKILFPNKGLFTLYDKPGGSNIGTVNLNTTNENSSSDNLTMQQLSSSTSAIYRTLLINRNNTVFKQAVHPKDIIKVNGNIYGVKIYAQKNGYLQIFPHSMRHKAWIAINDLDKQGFQFSSWRDYLLARPKKHWNVHAGSGLNLRETSNVKGKNILTIKRELFKINLTGQTKGLWMQVNVTRVSPDCLKEFEQYQGWIKALDDKGFPNIWSANSGC